MSTTIRILPSQADDLAQVCQMGSMLLARVAVAITEADLTIKRDKLRALISNVVDATQAPVLCRLVFGLSSVDSRNAESAEDTIKGLTSTLKARFEKDDRFRNWDEVSPSLLSILKCKSVHFAAKAADVSYDFEKILSDCRILTSIRPVFNESRDVILGNAVVQTLRIDFVDGSGHSDTTSISLDLSDVKKLGELCKHAEQKASLARVFLERTWPENVIMAGEEQK